MLIIWNSIHFDGRAIGFLIAFFAVMIFWIQKSKMHVNNVEKLKNDIRELEEYQE